MGTNRLVQCVVLLSLLGVIAAEARAEPMLLIEITSEGSSERGSIGEPIYLAFLTEDAPGITQHSLGGMYDTDDVGMTFAASPEVLAGMEEALTNGGRFGIDSQANAPPASAHADLIWTIDPPNWEITRHVPRLGLGLQGYDLTDITHTIDKIEYYQQANRFYSRQEHTIRLFGEPIPEPGFLLLTVHCALVGLACCKRVRVPVRLVNKAN